MKHTEYFYISSFWLQHKIASSDHFEISGMFTVVNKDRGSEDMSLPWKKL